MTALRFRAATLADVPALVPLINTAYRGGEGGGGWTTEHHLLQGDRIDAPTLSTLMADPAARFELALDAGGAIVGCVHLRREPDATCYLGMLSVRVQAGGVGKALLERSEAIAREWRCHRMRLTVIDARPELQAYYERRGYRLTGRREPWPEARRWRLRVADLAFVEMEKSL